MCSFDLEFIKIMNKKVDFLIIGSGIAGLSYALKVSKYGSVCIVTKQKIEDTATKYAQGGVAVVSRNPDSFEKHIKDTMIAGCNLNNKEIVKTVISEGPKRIKELINLGTHFDKDNSGAYDLAKEGGHTEPRILHSKDSTGLEIQNTLIEKVKANPAINILDHHFTIDLITQHHLGKLVKRKHENTECYGAYVLNLEKHKVFTVLAKTTLIATGGTGNLYFTTTNPTVSTGDGIAMVYRAKGVIKDMEFIQFHPTSLYNPNERPSFLITEALRGYGAILRNSKREVFMDNYDKRGSLAPRDVVARAIDNELKQSGEDYLFLDASMCDHDGLKEKFPNIFKKCLSLGIDIRKDYIPIVPSAHYMCGGIKVNDSGRSSIKYLYAAGEVAYTGMHGANRLASNSLLEALVFSHRAAIQATADFKNATIKSGIPEWDDSGTTKNEEMVLITQSLKEVQQIMTNYVGIVRSDLRLQRALDRLEIIYRETESLYKTSMVTLKTCELRNLINTGYLVIKMSQERKQSIGLHYSIDYLP